MKLEFTEVQAAWKSKGEDLARALPLDAAAGDAVMGAFRFGLLDPRADLLSIVAAVESVAYASPSAAAAIALHSVVAASVAGNRQYADALLRGERIGALSLSSEEVPADRTRRLTGRASWVAPITEGGLALVGARSGDDHGAFALPLNARGVALERVDTAGLRGLACAHVLLDDVEATPVGATVPWMARVRVLMAAVGLGIGRRALAEALEAARESGGGAAGEQTVQGLLADAATELDAAMLLTRKAASEDREVSLATASMAKLAATSAVQRAVERTTQVVGVETFRQGHMVERLAQDVRALELFAGRTEALRAAVAAEVLPNPSIEQTPVG